MNNEILKRVAEERCFMKYLKRRVLRHNGLLNKIIKGAVDGNNGRGRPTLEYVKQILEDTTS